MYSPGALAFLRSSHVLNTETGEGRPFLSSSKDRFGYISPRNKTRDPLDTTSILNNQKFRKRNNIGMSLDNRTTSNDIGIMPEFSENALSVRPNNPCFTFGMGREQCRPVYIQEINQKYIKK
jgi:hypothetical protein